MQFPEVRGIGRSFLDAALEGIEDASAQFLPRALHVARGEVGEHLLMQFFCDVGEFPGVRTGSADLPPEDSVPRILGVNRTSYAEPVSLLVLTAPYLSLSETTASFPASAAVSNSTTNSVSAVQTA